MITPEELKLVNKPETSIKTKDPKTGKEGYRIGLEVFHQLHCLNLIRKSTYRDHYKGEGDFAEEDEGKIRAHLGMDTLIFPVSKINDIAQLPRPREILHYLSSIQKISSFATVFSIAHFLTASKSRQTWRELKSGHGSPGLSGSSWKVITPIST